MKAELNIKDFSTADITKLLGQAFSDPKLVKIFEATLRKATGRGLSEDIFELMWSRIRISWISLYC